MNFDQNNNFEKPLFNTENISNSFEVNTSSLDSQDLPPEIDPIKNLSDANVFEAPTMDALGPMNIIPEFTHEIKDPLDEYEKYGFNTHLENNNPTLNEENFNYNPLLNKNINDISFNLNNINLSGNSINEQRNLVEENEEFKSYFNKQIEVDNNNSFLSNEYNSSKVSNSDYEIVEKSLLSNDKEDNINQLYTNELLKNDVKDNPSLTEFSEINNDYEEDAVTSVNKDEFIIEEKPLVDKLDDKLEKNDEMHSNDIDLLGLDEAYTEPDSLEILDDDIIDDLELNDNTKENNINSVEKIKLFVEELKSKGEKIKVEEFDFEMMHQLIIIIEK